MTRKQHPTSDGLTIQWKNPYLSADRRGAAVWIEGNGPRQRSISHHIAPSGRTGGWCQKTCFRLMSRWICSHLRIEIEIVTLRRRENTKQRAKQTSSIVVSTMSSLLTFSTFAAGAASRRVSSSVLGLAYKSQGAVSSSTTATGPSTLSCAVPASRFFHGTASVSGNSQDRHGTTIICVRKDGKVCMMGDGMVSMGSIVVKPNAKKIRRIISKTEDKKPTLVGFAGSTADAFTLLERLEGKLDEYPGQLARSCVELAKGWRTDKYLRRLEASLVVADETTTLEITGNGDVLEPHDGVISVGSGSPYAIGKSLWT